MEDEVLLPSAFADLAPFIVDWGGIRTQAERYSRRQAMPMERIQRYYDAVAPRLEAIFAHLDRFPFGAPLPPGEALLLDVAMGMTEVAQAVEMYGQPRVPRAPEGHSVAIRGLSCG